MEAQEGPTISSSQDEWAIIKQTVMGEKSGSTDYKDEPLPKVNRYLSLLFSNKRFK